MDANLEDDWLERLNDNLQSFKLISICEGHNIENNNNQGHRVLSPNSPRGRTHINIRLNEDLVNRLFDNWDVYNSNVQEAIKSRFNSLTTNVSFKLKYEYGFRNNNLFQKKDVVASFDLKGNPINQNEKISKNQWFSETIDAIECFDVFISDLLQFSVAEI